MTEQIFVDSISLLLSHNSDNNNLCDFERGPRYGEYQRLRESKLRMKREYEKILKEEEERFFSVDLAMKKTRFGFYNQAANPNRRRSSLGQSVPDFSAVIRKENRRPVNLNLLPRRRELTPPPMKTRNAAVFSGSPSSIRGSISASGGENKKKSKTMIGMARKSYANVEDLKKISMAAASAINGGGGRKSIGGGGRTVLGFRQIY